MQPPQHTGQDVAQCPICRARLQAALPFCPVCGAQLNGDSEREEEELRGILYLLSELKGWESSGRIAAAEAASLRAIYEERRDALRAELASRLSAKQEQQRAKDDAERERRATREPEFVAFPTRPASQQPPPRPQPPPPFAETPQRTLLERLADPKTLRLLLYMGAGMLVVGIIIWLRDLLYLKLQEPIVQAGLLATATIGLIASGWYTILRTRQRWTGRALTLAGSLLVPVNFWFLVRSGLIENQGRAWIVCAFCAVLYAHTAAVLRERLYVYMSAVASVAILWALILRDAPQAFGLYSLSLMAASLVFIHLTRLFPEKVSAEEAEKDDETERARSSVGRWSHELWSVPLARTALVFTALALFIYLPLRLSPNAASFYESIFRLRSSRYDAGVALLILAAAAYVLWFAGSYVYREWKIALHTASMLLFFLTVLVVCDGFRIRAELQVLTLSLVTFFVALMARTARSRELSEPLRYASLVTVLFMAMAVVMVILNSSGVTFTHSASLATVAASFAALSSTRFGSKPEQAILAHSAALYFSASYYVAVASASFKSETLNTLLVAVWPTALFLSAEAMTRLKRETQLAAPFTRVADALAALMLAWSALFALIIHLEGSFSHSVAILALGGSLGYGALRTARSRSVYGATLAALAAIVMAPAIVDALEKRGLWPASWPIAAVTVAFAFVIERACEHLFRADSSVTTSEAGAATSNAITRMMGVRLVLDAAVAVCALLWLIKALTNIYAGGFGAAVVLLLALLYWVERAAKMRGAWTVRVASAHAAAFLAALLIALRVDPAWMLLLFTLTAFPLFFLLGRYARGREWLTQPLGQAAVATLALSLLLALIQAIPHLQAGNPRLLSPALTTASVALLSFSASLLSRGRASVLYFRTGLWVSVVALMLAALRAGFDPISDVEVYTTPVALLILVIAYLSHRRAWAEYDADVGALLWMGSLLLAVPLLARAVEFRVLLDSAAPWRDVAILAASLGLILYGVTGRMRAPVIVGSVALVTELAVITLTSVDWLQVPLKYYLITVGALLLLIFGTLEYRREQFLLMRRRFQQRRDSMREQFGEWR
ncbi:MAG TPA: hypothetical protein VJS44_17035 [Pyrinomonadaceae bacterium]|nr:hypothetical protein [Pyrinomonadaceae bacterium]